MIFRSPIIKHYHRYRKAGTKLHHKVIDKYMDDKILQEAAKELRLGKKRELVIDTEDDLSVLMDYALYEIRVEGETLIEKYQSEVGGKNRVERDLLSAKVKATTGLFIVREVWSQKYSVGLADLLDEDRKITLTDINFSQTIITDVIIFFRPLELPDFTTTSGIAFVFPAEMETELKEKWQRWGNLGAAKRYARIFNLYKSRGIPTFYE